MVEKEMGVTEARKEFSSLVRDVQYQGGAYVISRHGEKAAAVVPIQVYRDWKKQRKEFFDQIREIQDKADLSPQEASQLASEAVAAVRSERDQPS
ncbi:MAG: type II toxin-antitoxin system Phd/YefM family antitoxin [Anaerolineales bacterium]